MLSELLLGDLPKKKAHMRHWPGFSVLPKYLLTILLKDPTANLLDVNDSSSIQEHVGNHYKIIILLIESSGSYFTATSENGLSRDVGHGEQCF